MPAARRYGHLHASRPGWTELAAALACARLLARFRPAATRGAGGPVAHRRLVACGLVAGALIAGTIGASGHETVHESLKIVHPYTKEPASGVRDLDVSMTIRNSGTEAERIIAASSPMAASVEIRAAAAAQANSQPDGQSDGQSAIEIPAGGSVKLSAAGPHIRLRGLTEPLTGYATFPLWLTFAHAGRVEVEVMVEEIDDAAADPHAGHDHAGSPPQQRAAPAVDQSPNGETK